jgi:hypothetical protein
MRIKDLLSALLVALVSVFTAPAQAATQVGFAVRDITPTGSLSGICLGGYGSCTCREATGVNDRIYARAMVLHSTTTGMTVALLSLDVVGASSRVIDSIQAKVNATRTLIPSSNIIVAQTHSHAAPDLVGLWGKVTSTYKTFLTDQAAAAIQEAFNAKVDAYLYVSSGTFSETRNRRGWDSTDRDLVVLDARTAATGARIGTLINFAAHPVVLGSSNTLISRDWVGYMVDAAEVSLGANKVMFINGAQGDVSPKTDVTGGATEFERARLYGQAVARRSLEVMSGGQVSVGEGVKLSSISFTQCITNQNFLSAAAIGCMDYDLLSGTGCSSTGLFAPKTINSQVAHLRLGTQVQAAVLPGEALTRMSIDGVGATGYPASTGSIKSVMKAPVKMVLGMSTDFLGYFVPEDEWNSPTAGKNPANSDYEEGVSLGGNKANIWLRDRSKSLITQDNGTF